MRTHCVREVLSLVGANIRIGIGRDEEVVVVAGAALKLSKIIFVVVVDVGMITCVWRVRTSYRDVDLVGEAESGGDNAVSIASLHAIPMKTSKRR